MSRPSEKEWSDWPTDRLVRDIFIASREPIQNELLLLREDVR